MSKVITQETLIARQATLAAAEAVYRTTTDACAAAGQRVDASADLHSRLTSEHRRERTTESAANLATAEAYYNAIDAQGNVAVRANLAAEAAVVEAKAAVERAEKALAKRAA